MQKLFLILLSFFLLSFTPRWEMNLTNAQKTAAAEKKFILLNFSGSDWCGPCIRMHKEIFSSDSFSGLAESSLVLVNADFPRQKKNQLSKAQQEENDHMAESYNRNGFFPYTLLLNAEGKIIKSWEGYPKGGAQTLVKEIKDAISTQ